MSSLETITQTIETWIPLSYAEPWDPVGLSIGRYSQTIQSIMTCLTITPEVVEEAIKNRTELIITHHPFPFHAIKRFHSSCDAELVCKLIENRICVYSSHTAYDNAPGGINEQILVSLVQNQTQSQSSGLSMHSLTESSGKFANLKKPIALDGIVNTIKKLFGCSLVKISLCLAQSSLSSYSIQRPASACGSASSFVTALKQHACDLLICGELKYHECLELRAHGCNIILGGHFHSEKFAMDHLAKRLKHHFPQLHVCTSKHDLSPTAII